MRHPLTPSLLVVLLTASGCWESRPTVGPPGKDSGGKLSGLVIKGRVAERNTPAAGEVQRDVPTRAPAPRAPARRPSASPSPELPREAPPPPRRSLATPMGTSFADEHEEPEDSSGNTTPHPRSP